MTDEEKRAQHDAGATHTYRSAAEAFNAPIAFNINDQAIAEVKEDFKDVDAYQDLDAAKAAKKTLTKMRTALGDAHKEAKSDALEYGRKCDAEKNRLLAAIKEIEDPISRDLDTIKNKAIIAEEERVGGIMALIDIITAHAADRHDLDLANLRIRRESLTTIKVTEEEYQEFAEQAQLATDEADLKLRLAIDREETRIKEEAEQAEIAAENKRLADELAERQAKMDAEDAERKAIRDREDQERLSRDFARNAEIKAAQDKVDEEQAAAQKKIDDENHRLQLEANERDAEEERKNLAAEEEARKLEQAPDRDKLLVFADSVDQLLKTKPTLDTDVANEVLLNAAAMLIEVAYDIRKMTEEMK